MRIFFEILLKTFYSVLNLKTNGDGILTYKSSNENVATINGNVLTISNIGYSDITVTHEETNNYFKFETKLWR